MRISSLGSSVRDVASGSEVAVVAGTIIETAMCLPCIAKRSGMSTARVNALLRSVAMNLRLALSIRPCAACLETKITFGINPNGYSQGPRT